MISFDKYLLLNEKEMKDNLNNLKNIAKTAYIQAHKDNPEAKNKMPKGITNAQDVSSLKDSIKNWKDSDNKIFKNAYSKINNLSKNDKNSEDEDKETDKETDKDNKENEKTNFEKETDKEIEQIKKEVEKGLKDPLSVDDSILDRSEFVSRYDPELAKKLADIEVKKEENKKLIKQVSQQNAEKRAENFKKVMESLAELLKLFVPDMNDNALTKIGDNAISSQKKKAQEDNAIEVFDSKVKDSYKNADNELNSALDAVDKEEQLAIEEIKNSKSFYNTKIQSKCKNELDNLNMYSEQYNKLKEQKKKLYEKISEYEERYNELSDEEKEMLKELDKQSEELDEELRTSKENVDNANAKYKEKIKNEESSISKEIEKMREEEIKKAKEKFDIQRKELSLHTEKRKSEIKNSKNSLVEYLKFINSSYPDQRDVPESVRKKLENYKTKFQETLMNKEELEKAKQVKNNSSKNSRYDDFY